VTTAVHHGASAPATPGAGCVPSTQRRALWLPGGGGGGLSGDRGKDDRRCRGRNGERRGINNGPVDTLWKVARRPSRGALTSRETRPNRGRRSVGDGELLGVVDPSTTGRLLTGGPVPPRHTRCRCARIAAPRRGSRKTGRDDVLGVTYGFPFTPRGHAFGHVARRCCRVHGPIRNLAHITAP